MSIKKPLDSVPMSELIDSVVKENDAEARVKVRVEKRKKIDQAPFCTGIHLK